MAKSCKGLAAELVRCLSESDCVKVENRSIRDCAGEKSPSVPSECVGLRETYFNCKRGQVTIATRISLGLAAVCVNLSTGHTQIPTPSDPPLSVGIATSEVAEDSLDSGNKP
ncbi:Mitochondrial protein pet191 homolog [Linum perenne]